MGVRLSAATYLSRVAVPVLGVVASLALLMLAAAGAALDWWPEATQHRLLALGVLAWMAGIAWGTWVNGRPLPRGDVRA